MASIGTPLRTPPADLLDDLRNDRDTELGDSENVCTAQNRHLRLYVAACMLSDGTKEGDRRALELALEMYAGCGRELLDRPNARLTVAHIATEVMMMTQAMGIVAPRCVNTKQAQKLKETGT